MARQHAGLAKQVEQRGGLQPRHVNWHVGAGQQRPQGGVLIPVGGAVVGVGGAVVGVGGSAGAVRVAGRGWRAWCRRRHSGSVQGGTPAQVGTHTGASSHANTQRQQQGRVV